MADLPIIFSAPMVCALLDGRKTMTRRMAWRDCPRCDGEGYHRKTGKALPEDGCRVCIENHSFGYVASHWQKAHHKFQAGEPLTLWVKETWADVNCEDGPALLYRANEAVRTWHKWCVEPGPDYGAGPSMNYDLYPGNYSMWWSDLLAGQPDHSWRSPRFQPRWASRLTLIVTGSKIERLHDISCADAIAEGIPPAANSLTIDCETPNPRDGFKSLWNSLNGPDAWERNEEVVALTFRVEQRNIDAQEAA